MASRSADICILCTEDDISNNAITWCTECEVFLCTDCEKHHKRSKASKEHSTMCTVDYHKLPQFMHETSNRCIDHDKNYELYCSFHSCPCCIQCIANKHQKCQDLKALDDILKDFKSSAAAIPLLKKDLKDLRESFEEVIKLLKDKIKTIHIQKTKGIQEVRTTRKLLNDYFDKLEREILDDLDSKHSKLTSDMGALVQQMENSAKRIDQLQDDFSTMTKHATELQTYIGLREIEKSTSQEANYLDELVSGSQLNDVEITVSSTVKSVLQDIKSFGNISVKSSTKTFQTKIGRKDQAQHLVPMVYGIEQIKPSLLNSLSVPKGDSLKRITGQILPDGMLLLFHNKKNTLIQYNSDGTFMKELMAFKEQPYDVCFVKDNTVAVTFNHATKVLLVDVEKNQLIKTIELALYCYGVSSDGEVLVISHKEARKTTILNLTDMTEEILEGIRLHRISLFNGNIYGTYYYEDRVDCYRITGEHVWTFTHEDIYQPEGIAVDMNGFVYITSLGKNKIVVLSSDGKSSRTVLCKEDGIMEPYAIDINKELRTMMVACVDGKTCAFIFKI